LKLGNAKVANIVALGCFAAKSGMVKIDSITQIIEEMAPKDRKELIAINKNALSAGQELIK
jgi:2-oxoglutarate ferredoxin oxidoreductase subunit gamma